MEKRDGTPFMGLTTQDGIPSVDAKTTNKRCTSCLNKAEQCTCKAFFVQKCKDCLHFAASPERHREHRREARHIHSYRNRAYREPKKRAMWLRIWFDSLEEVEGANPWALAFDEEEEK